LAAHAAGVVQDVNTHQDVDVESGLDGKGAGGECEGRKIEALFEESASFAWLTDNCVLSLLYAYATLAVAPGQVWRIQFLRFTAAGGHRRSARLGRHRHWGGSFHGWARLNELNNL
jgi:hypothetical protein